MREPPFSLLERTAARKLGLYAEEVRAICRRKTPHRSVTFCECGLPKLEDSDSTLVEARLEPSLKAIQCLRDSIASREFDTISKVAALIKEDVEGGRNKV